MSVLCWRFTQSRLKRSATASSFKGEAGFVISLDKARREFVNRNAAAGTSSSRSPELLAKHADALLHKNNKVSEEGDLEGALSRVVRRPRVIRREAPVNARSTDGHIQVLGGEGCLPNILFDNTHIFFEDDIAIPFSDPEAYELY
jgi:hypothetical protein